MIFTNSSLSITGDIERASPFKVLALLNCTTTYKKICSTLWKNVYKCIKVSKSNNYKDLCIRHTFVKREF